VEWASTPFYVNRTNKPWPRQPGRPRLGAVSAFGISGTNAHMLIESYEAPPAEVSPLHASPYYLLALSAKTSQALQQRIEDLIAFLRTRAWDKRSFAALSYTLLCTRMHLNHRCALIATNAESALQLLSKFHEHQSLPNVFTGRVSATFRSLPALSEYAGAALTKLPSLQADAEQYRESMYALANLYCQGYDLPWDRLFGSGKPRRLSLPTYPFAQESYWVAASPSQGRPTFDAQFVERMLNGVVHGNMTVDAAVAAASARLAGGAVDLSESTPRAAAPRTQSAVDRWESSLHRRATLATGLDDFGSESYRPALRRLLWALDGEACLSGASRESISRMLAGFLASRLKSELGWQRTPQCLQEPVVAPLVIAGMPRTGTTLLHKLLALDPQFQGLQQWIAHAPRVRPAPAEWSAEQEFRAAQSEADETYRRSPDLRIAHWVGADEVDECRLLLAQDFVHEWFGSIANIPSYDKFAQFADMQHAYQRYADNLRLIGYGSDRRWLLKDPCHAARLQTLGLVFPDALIVQTHRDPAAAIPSLCSTVRATLKVFGTYIDPADIGRSVVNSFAATMTRAMESRQALRNTVVDVKYADLERAPLDIVRQLYQRLALELQPAVEQRMTEWLQSHPKHEHGEHRYSLDEFGLSDEEIRERFSSYVDAYELLEPDPAWAMRATRLHAMPHADRR